MKNFLKTAVAGCAVLCSFAANADTTANVAYTTDYVFRGISVSNESFAIQGGFDWTHDSGFYAGTWASSLSGGNGSELDIFAGYYTKMGALRLHGGLYHYNYARNSAANINEILIGVGFGPVDLEIWHADKSINDDLSSTKPNWEYEYIELNAEFEPMKDIGLALHVGKWLWHGASDGVNSWKDNIDYSVSISKEIAKLDWTVSAHGNGMSKGDKGVGALCGDAEGRLCDSRVVLTVSKTMDL
jgi:uncharacterized protein (TIGR02001 family)